jgi:hypothetical protein
MRSSLSIVPNAGFEIHGRSGGGLPLTPKQWRVAFSIGARIRVLWLSEEYAQNRRGVERAAQNNGEFLFDRRHASASFALFHYIFRLA